VCGRRTLLGMAEPHSKITAGWWALPEGAKVVGFDVAEWPARGLHPRMVAPGPGRAAGRTLPGMDEPNTLGPGVPGQTSDAGGTWPCEAYGPEGVTHGALCFFSPELGQRACATLDECRGRLAPERERVVGRIAEMADEGKPGTRYLAARITRPGQILGGDEPADHAFVPSEVDHATLGAAGTWCAVWLDAGDESDHCGMPPEDHPEPVKVRDYREEGLCAAWRPDKPAAPCQWRPGHTFAHRDRNGEEWPA
jgi:hypothetical protein